MCEKKMQDAAFLRDKSERNNDKLIGLFKLKA